jgi:hypothetical protein
MHRIRLECSDPEASDRPVADDVPSFGAICYRADGTGGCGANSDSLAIGIRSVSL